MQSARESDRAARRRQRELQSQYKEALKRNALRAAQLEVEEYENQIEVVTSVHKQCGPTWDWEAVLAGKSKIVSPPSPVAAATAEADLGNYVPGFFAKLFGTDKKKRKALAEVAEAARQEYKWAVAGWEKLTSIAEGIVAKNHDLYVEAIGFVDPFGEIGELGSLIKIATGDVSHLVAEFTVHAETVLPKQSLTLTKTGKVSRKDIPKTRFAELYQDYVCSCALRIGREICALLPVDVVLVHALAEMIDKSDGHLKEQPILSVLIPRNTMGRLNFDAIDCSDSMSNFVHNMDFKKSRGFVPVERLTIEDYTGSSQPRNSRPV